MSTDQQRKIVYPIRIEHDCIDKVCNRFMLHMQLHCYRKRMGLTQQDAADISGLSIGTIRNIENGNGSTLDSILKYADALGYILEIKPKQVKVKVESNEQSE